MHPHFTTFFVCGLTALAAQAPAQASTSTATANIEQFALRLVDLDLNDGVVPSITFDREYLLVDAMGGGQRQSLDAYGSAAIGSTFGSAAGTVSETAVLSAASVNHPLPIDGAHHNYRNDSYRSSEFTLSPNTQLILTGVGRISHDLQEYFSFSTSYLGMEGVLWDESGGWMNSFRKQYDTRDGSATIDLSATLTTDGQQRKGRFLLQTYAILSGPVTTVPEPSAYAMLLTGTFVLGALAARRRRGIGQRAA